MVLLSINRGNRDQPTMQWVPVIQSKDSILTMRVLLGFSFGYSSRIISCLDFGEANIGWIVLLLSRRQYAISSYITYLFLLLTTLIIARVRLTFSGKNLHPSMLITKPSTCPFPNFSSISYYSLFGIKISQSMIVFCYGERASSYCCGGLTSL